MSSGNPDNNFSDETYRRSPGLSRDGVTVYSYVVFVRGDPTIYRGRVTRRPRSQARPSERWMAQDDQGRKGYGSRRDKAVADLLGRAIPLAKLADKL